MSLQKKFSESEHLCRVTFSLPKEAVNGAKEVKLLGDFNNWEKDDGILMHLKKGQFTTSTDLQPGQEYQFRYLLDNEIWANDWNADKYVPTPFGEENSVVVITDQMEAVN